MAGILIEPGKPLQVSFRELRDALQPLHLNQPAWVDRLHDVWKQGAPTPESIIRNPRGYDERLRQAGNVERRVVLPTPLATWCMDAARARGIALSFLQATRLLNGEVDLGLENAGGVK